MTEFDPGKFEEKYVHCFEELEAAYSNAYQSLHGERDSELLRAIDRRVLAESEPFYEGDGTFRVELPADLCELAGRPGDETAFEAVLDDLVAEIEAELRAVFDLDDA
ncbi:hypothetical protein BRC89_04900 [Halobacteriales archaeon QS_4_70_19]|nr:MAG: hypothetical protein BRC89_04900 [Halobacteriales archaeon QS_4_70_19]